MDLLKFLNIPAVKGEVIEAGDKTSEMAKESKTPYYRQEVAINDGTREVNLNQ